MQESSIAKDMLAKDIAYEVSGKSATAYRTISEVATELDVPQHVLRFWESKFSQIRPLKRGGGRRYYRPEDVDALKRIRHFLYEEGYTIRGVQRLLREARRSPAATAGQRVAEIARELEAMDNLESDTMTFEIVDAEDVFIPDEDADEQITEFTHQYASNVSAEHAVSQSIFAAAENKAENKSSEQAEAENLPLLQPLLNDAVITAAPIAPAEPIIEPALSEDAVPEVVVPEAAVPEVIVQKETVTITIKESVYQLSEVQRAELESLLAEFKLMRDQLRQSEI